jgi:hypothetical protein
MPASQLMNVRPFPQLQRRKQFRSDFLRALYSRTTNNEIAFRWINRDFVRGLQQHETPPLTAVAERIVAEVQANGIAFANFTEFFEASFFDEIKDAFDVLHEEFNRTRRNELSGKEVFLDTIHKAHTFTVNDPVSTYLSAPVFAAISCRYMKMVPRYVGSSFWHTKPAPSDRVYSQMWHRDYNDRRLVKIFLYLNDVGRENGFFEYATRTHVNGVLGRAFDRIGADGYRAYPDQDEVEGVIGKLPVISLDQVPPAKRYGNAAPWHNTPSVIECLGPAGTMIFADTFGIHRGGFVKNGHRDMIMSTYSTNFNVHKPHFAVTAEFASTLSPFMRMAFGLA